MRRYGAFRALLMTGNREPKPENAASSLILFFSRALNEIRCIATVDSDAPQKAVQTFILPTEDEIVVNAGIVNSFWIYSLLRSPMTIGYS